MQVDTRRPNSSSPVFAGFEDFLNMDAFAASNSSASSASSHSPRSPPSQAQFDTFGTDHSTAIVSQSPSDFFDFHFTGAVDEYSNFVVSPMKTNNTAPSPEIAVSAAPFDFMGTSMDMMSQFTSNPSPETAPTASDASDVGGNIDPQLMSTPALTDRSHFEGEEESDFSPEAEQEMNLISEVSSTLKAPAKAARTAGSRKGTVASGGVTKKSSGPSFLRDKDAPAKDGDDEEDDDSWRPTAEEYRKMSSKEKRQLRNKISARNFRVRRKEYITTLESHLAERDSLLETIRAELASTNSENGALRAEIAQLKRTILARPQDSPVLPPPGPLPSTSSPRPTSPSVNTTKDLPTSPRLGGRANAFWGGLNAGGFTPVHTTRVPALSEVLARKASENINPFLTAPVDPSPFAPATLPGGRPSINPKDNRDFAASFDGFADRTPFTLRAMDSYRMQLWGKIGQQNHPVSNSFHNNTHNPKLTGLAANLLPAYFQGQPPRSTRPLASQNTNTPSSSAPKEEVIMAHIASQTLLGRLGSAFWDAFSDRQGTDVEKVKKVLEGKAVLRVVDLETVKPSAPSSSPIIKRERITPLRALSEPKVPAASTKKEEDRLMSCMTDVLEQSMRSLTLAAKKS